MVVGALATVGCADLAELDRFGTGRDPGSGPSRDRACDDVTEDFADDELNPPLVVVPDVTGAAEVRVEDERLMGTLTAAHDVVALVATAFEVSLSDCASYLELETPDAEAQGAVFFFGYAIDTERSAGFFLYEGDLVGQSAVLGSEPDREIARKYDPEGDRWLQLSVDGSEIVLRTSRNGRDYDEFTRLSPGWEGPPRYMGLGVSGLFGADAVYYADNLNLPP